MNETTHSSESARVLDAVVIGGGQAGLAMGSHLKRQDRDFVILDDQQRIGDAWRGRWDSLRLDSMYSINSESLPGTVRDAAYLARRIAAERPAAVAAPQAAAVPAS